MHLKRSSFNGDHFISCTGTDGLTDPISVTNFYHNRFVIQDPTTKSFGPDDLLLLREHLTNVFL